MNFGRMKEKDQTYRVTFLKSRFRPQVFGKSGRITSEKLLNNSELDQRASSIYLQYQLEGI